VRCSQGDVGMRFWEILVMSCLSGSFGFFGVYFMILFPAHILSRCWGNREILLLYEEFVLCEAAGKGTWFDTFVFSCSGGILWQ
jgi:hypothetical protein